MAKKNALFPIEYDEVSLVDNGAAGGAHVVIFKRGPGKVVKPPKVKTKLGAAPRVKQGRSQSNPCSTKTNSTGQKTGKSSTRAKNWNESKHPRNKKGQMATTSAKSKAAHGKGGTTKAKLDAKCRSKGVSKNYSFMSWNTDAIVRSKMERKAT